MSRPKRFAPAISTLAIAAMLTGCAVGQEGRQAFASRAGAPNLGLALQAQASLSSGQFAQAVTLAEQAVAAKPNDSELRALLGNCYFAAGRFASAEQAYRDSLSLMPAQPKLVLKLALVEIAQGRDADALAALDAARTALDPADYGLAIALAGRPSEAVNLLDQVARAPGADARIRQNLALAYGLSGDWAMAKTVAAQDVAPEQLDGRIQQWMAVATPARPSDQVAMLTGVHPSADPGQPQALALTSSPAGVRLAQLLPKTAPAPVQPTSMPQQVASVPATPPPALPDPEPAVAEANSVEIPPPAVVAQAARSLLTPSPVAQPLPQDDVAQPEAPMVQAVAPQPLPEAPTRFDTPVEPAKYIAITDTVRRAAKDDRRSDGRSSSVVQLGAYSSADRVSVAWQTLAKRYPALGDYTPMRARYTGAKGTVWRLSIKGFTNQQEAIARCEQLQSRGGKCFVRRVAGDSPVQFASR
jgi:Flp pilus assembly protein TadD